MRFTQIQQTIKPWRQFSAMVVNGIAVCSLISGVSNEGSRL